jgi:hypothetical protein
MARGISIIESGTWDCFHPLERPVQAQPSHPVPDLGPAGPLALVFFDVVDDDGYLRIVHCRRLAGADAG